MLAILDEGVVPVDYQNAVLVVEIPGGEPSDFNGFGAISPPGI